MKLYDNDIENLFSKTPSVFQNIGTGILSILLIMLLGISYIVRYPDKIVADISLYSESSSVSFYAFWKFGNCFIKFSAAVDIHIVYWIQIEIVNKMSKT